MKKISDSLFESIDFVKEDLLSSPEEFDEIVNKIPVFKDVWSVFKLYGSINEYLFKKRVMMFLQELSSIDQDKRQKFIEKIKKNEKEFGLKILKIIEKIDDEKISIFFNKWFKCYVLGEISKEQFNRGLNIIQKIYIDDLEYFLNSKIENLELTGNSEEYPNEYMFPLIHNGLLGYGNNSPTNVSPSWDGESEYQITVTIWITEVGKKMREFLS